MSLVSIFATAILPVIAIGAVGFLLGRTQNIDVGPLNTVTVYVLAPALVFHSLATTTLGGSTVVKIVVGVALYLVLMTAVTELLGRALGTDEPLLSALVLASAYPNSGNFGIPVSEFAFGSVGRSTAVLYLVGQSVLTYTAGVYLASRGSGTRGLHGVKQVFKLPLIYAVAGALLVRGVGLVPPADSTAMATLKLVGDSSIPLMLLLVGIQLSRTDVRAALGHVSLATGLKLLVAPFVGIVVVLALGIPDATAGRVFVLECATPAAITPLILLIEFEGDTTVDGVSGAEFVSAVVLVSTLLSVPTLTVLIALLESGVL